MKCARSCAGGSYLITLNVVTIVSSSAPNFGWNVSIVITLSTISRKSLGSNHSRTTDYIGIGVCAAMLGSGSS